LFGHCYDNPAVECTIDKQARKSVSVAEANDDKIKAMHTPAKGVAKDKMSGWMQHLL